nr:hypothetical protein [Tanacetum cinerariifolium]
MKYRSTGPSAQQQDDASANIVHESSSPPDAETGADLDKTTSGGDTEILHIDEDQGKDVDNQVNLEKKTAKLDQSLAGSDPGKNPESRPPPEQVFMEEDQAGPNPRVSCVALAGPNTEPTHEKFMANVYPDVHGSLKLPVDEHVILEEPLSSSETLSSMKNLDDAYTFGDHTSDSELATRVATLEQKLTAFEQNIKTLDNTNQDLGCKVFTLELQDLPHKIDQTINTVVKEAVHIGLQAPLRDRFRELPEADMKEILHQRMDEFLAKKDKSRKRHRDDQDPLPPPSDSDPNNVNVSDFEDTDTTHLPKLKTIQDWMKPVPEEDKPTTLEPDWVIPPNELSEPENNWANALANSYQDLDEYKLLRQTDDISSFINWFCKRIRKKKLSKTNLEGLAFKAVWPFHDNIISLQFQMEECHRMLTDQVDLVNPEGHRIVPDISKPLPLEVPPMQVTIQSQYFFNKDLEYLESGDKGRRSALSISNLKAAHYLEFVLEELVPFLWIESEHEYDISVAYEIVLRTADYKEYKISEADFKNLHPNDFEDLYLLHLQDWDASDFLFKKDYTIVSKPRVIIYKDKNKQKMMRGTEVHKFSDGTVHGILEKLDHMVKDFRLFKYNSGMTVRIWSKDDKRRSKEFMKVIEHRLKLQRIFKSLESFVGGRLRDIDYRLIQRTE